MTEKLDEIFRYDPISGKLFWREMRNGRRNLARECGYVWKTRRIAQSGVPAEQRYRIITLDGEQLRAHNIAWEIVNGPIPAGFIIDHRDGDGLNNRIENLRRVKPAENSRNMSIPVNNTSGITGVYLNKKTNKWVAAIRVDGKLKYLGSFDQKGDALAARREAEKTQGYFRRHGRVTLPDRERLKFFHMP
jgi:hypothetical protein